jgi:Ser/Thr protein kinase RdoA (MazF antagonist)
MSDYHELSRREQIGRLRRLARSALDRYGIEPTGVSLLAHLYNTTFAVTARDGTRYVLRIHRSRGNPIHPPPTRAEVESELWWLERLRADLDLSVPEPVRTPQGEGVVSVGVEGVPEARLCVLFRWLAGRFLHHRLMPAHLERVGRLTACLHEHSAHLTVPSGFERQRVDETAGETREATMCLFADRWSSHSAEVVEAVFERARRAQEELGRGPETFGLVHGDIHQENYLFDGADLRLIDFDDSGWGHYLYDLAVTVHEIDYLPRGPALQAALLAGYRQIRDLSPAHEAMIEPMYMLRELQITTWFLQERDNPSFPDWADHVRWGLEMLERSIQV